MAEAVEESDALRADPGMLSAEWLSRPAADKEL